ncbi:MAG: LytTR family DNA-binding domain-containing protein [Candidatus Izemoplasmatales bacterium]
MKVRVEEIADLEGTEVVVRCRARDGEVERVVDALGFLDEAVVAKKDGRSYRVPLADVFYFENVDDRTFVNLRKEVLETAMRLHEVESTLRGSTFVRVGRNTIVDAAKIASFKSALNGRMEARLQNGETVEISRAYVGAIKAMLGGTRR